MECHRHPWPRPAKRLQVRLACQLRFVFDWLCAAERPSEAEQAKAANSSAPAKPSALEPEEELSVEESLTTASDVPALYPAVLEAVKRQSGATAAYVFESRFESGNLAMISGGKNTGPASRAMAKGYEWDPGHTWLASDLANLLEELAKPGVAAKMDMGDPRNPEPEARAALVQLIKDVSARPKAQDPEEREQGQMVYDGKNWREAAEGKDEL